MPHTDHNAEMIPYPVTMPYTFISFCLLTLINQNYDYFNRETTVCLYKYYKIRNVDNSW